MKHAMVRLLTVLAVTCSTVLVAQCGGSSESPSSPSAPAPSGGGGGTPPPAPAGNSLSVAPSTIQGQGQPQGTVTLASVAPSGGMLVSLSSSTPAVAKVPATILVAAGSRSTSFVIDTASVSVATTVTITASFSGGSMSANLTVTSAPLSAAFVVASQTHGVGGCELADSLSELDCVLDGSSSSGNPVAWIWTYTAGTNTLGHTSTDYGTHPQITTKCAFLSTATGGDDPNGDKYLKMTVTLQVQDRGGARSGIVTQQVKLFPHRNCGFNY